MGYCMQTANVIYNGIDTQYFTPQDSSHLKKTLDILQDSFVFGISARMDKVKDYPLLAKGAREMHPKHLKVIFIAIGKNNPESLQ